MNIRSYIKKNLKDCSVEDIKETIVTSINSEDEVILPGLGVLFEIYWNNINDTTKKDITDTLFKSLKKA